VAADQLTLLGIPSPLSCGMLLAASSVLESPREIDPLVAAAVSGDAAAIERLLTELLPRVRNLVRYLVHGDEDVDDISQEALILIVRGLATYRGEGTLESWVGRVVARRTFAWLRRRRAEPSRPGPSADLVCVGEDGTLPESYLRRREVARLLDELPAAQRQAVVLHHVLQMSVSEIAVEVDAPVETVRSRLRLGVARLREMMANAPERDEQAREHHDAHR